MKSFLAVTIFVISLSSLAAVPDFFCEAVKENEHIEVRFEKGGLTFNDGRSTMVAVANKKNLGHMLKVSGLATGMVFPGGGRQSVTVEVDKESKKGMIRIYTKTFYRQSDRTENLTCTIQS